MPATTLPFICSQCGHHYGDGPHGVPILIEDGSYLKNVTLEMSGIHMPCPRCGQVNQPALPDGVYNAGGGRWELVRRITEDLASAHAAPEEFENLIRLLRAAEAGGQSASQVAGAIETETPFHQLAETIRRHPNITNLIISNLVSIIVTIIVAVFLTPTSAPSTASGQTNLTQRQIDQIAARVTRQLEKDEKQTSPPGRDAPIREGPARNKPCYCGSGIKYKKCCASKNPKE